MGDSASGFKGITEYARRLEALGRQASPCPAKVEQALNGQAWNIARDHLPRSTLREHGIFFTGSWMAADALADALDSLTEDSFLLDPACGAGDLLLGAVKFLPRARGTKGTLRQWGKQIAGLDLFAPLARLTRARLALAVGPSNGGSQNAGGLSRTFPCIQSGNGLRVVDVYERATHIVMNPPYVPIPSVEGCEWRSGTVTAAAVFVDRAVSLSRPGTSVIAILPEVLRSGSSYRRWRKWIAAMADITHVTPLGRFSPDCDVDVFMLRAQVRRRRTPTASWPALSDGERTVGDLFRVRVGPVVPHRLKPDGAARVPFLETRNCPPGATIRRIQSRIEFSGTLYEPPFVAIRRTSSPSDSIRAISTLVTGKRAVAVENHLLVARPMSGTLKDCKALMRHLTRDESQRWLNERYRCRHLTTSSIATLPWRAGSK